MLGIQSTSINSRNLTDQAISDLTETAKVSARAVDDSLNTELDAIRTESQIIALADYLSLPRSLRAGSAEEARAYSSLLALKRKNSVFISSYALLDINGIDVLDTYQEDIGINKSDRDYFKAPLATGVPYVSPVRISQTTGQYSIYFSAPVRNKIGDVVGVLRSRYSAALLQNVLKESTDTANKEEYSVIVDNETFLRIAHSGSRDLLYKTYQELTPEQTLELQNKLRLPSGAPVDIIVADPEVVKGIENIDNEPLFVSDATEIYDGKMYTGGYKVQNTNWTVIVRRTERSILAPIESQTRVFTVAALVIIIVAALAGILLAQLLAQPITQLAGIAAEITHGNLKARAKIVTQDEIGDLGNSFNTMTRQLQDTLGGLERRVAERTADVELARLMSEQRAQELQAISEISRTISTEQRLNILLPLVSRLVSERFDFYHVGIFFVDESRKYAVLQASNSEGGKRMIERGHQLEVGHTGIVGYVAQAGKHRIALDVGSDAVFFNNPDLPETRSEMALPLNVRGQTIGVLDVQSTRSGAFTESDANTLSILADQVAIAIENARLFGQTQEALNEVQKLYQQYQSQEWTEYMRQSAYVGYRQNIFEGKLLDSPVETDEIRRALQNGEVVVLESESEKSQSVIAIPVKLRGQTIGVLNIKAPKRRRKWNQDEITLAQAVSDRLALALDNARLLHDSQRRAAKEQKIGEMTAKIGASINMRSVLQTAVEELGRALPGSEVVIQFQSTQEN
jgi:GAF domain-containing protein/HAMP domain-containing protein